MEKNGTRWGCSCRAVWSWELVSLPPPFILPSATDSLCPKGRALLRGEQSGGRDKGGGRRGWGPREEGKSSAGARQGERFPLLLQSPPRGAASPADVVRPPRPASRPPSWAGSGAAEGQEEAAEGKRRRRRRGGSGEAAVGARVQRAAAAAPEGKGGGRASGPPLRARAEGGGGEGPRGGEGTAWSGRAAAAAASPVRTCPALPRQGRGRRGPVRPVPRLRAGACRAHPAPPQPSRGRRRSGSRLCGWGDAGRAPSASRCVTAVSASPRCLTCPVPAAFCVPCNLLALKIIVKKSQKSLCVPPVE